MDKRSVKLPGWIFPVLLTVYSLLLVNQGVTVTDTGYNYGNFIHFESLDGMWKFSTYLATAIGSFFTKLRTWLSEMPCRTMPNVMMAAGIIVRTTMVRISCCPRFCWAEARELRRGKCIRRTPRKVEMVMNTVLMKKR